MATNQTNEVRCPRAFGETDSHTGPAGGSKNVVISLKSVGLNVIIRIPLRDSIHVEDTIHLCASGFTNANSEYLDIKSSISGAIKAIRACSSDSPMLQLASAV